MVIDAVLVVLAVLIRREKKNIRKKKKLASDLVLHLKKKKVALKIISIE